MTRIVEWSDSPGCAALVFGVAVPLGMVVAGYVTGHLGVAIAVACWVAVLMLFITAHDRAVKTRRRVDREADEAWDATVDEAMTVAAHQRGATTPERVLAVLDVQAEAALPTGLRRRLRRERKTRP